MKINERQLRQIIRESLNTILNEQSQSWYDYVHKNGLHPSPEEIKTAEDKRMSRYYNVYNDGSKQYQWDSPIAQEIYRGANERNINKIGIWSKMEIPTEDLHKMNGEDPLLNWDYVPGTEGTEYLMKINGSQLRRAKDAYITKRMTPAEKEQYYKEKYKGRYNTENNEFERFYSKINEASISSKYSLASMKLMEPILHKNIPQLVEIFNTFDPETKSAVYKYYADTNRIAPQFIQAMRENL